jgi:hypothetical protein
VGYGWDLEPTPWFDGVFSCVIESFSFLVQKKFHLSRVFLNLFFLHIRSSVYLPRPDLYGSILWIVRCNRCIVHVAFAPLSALGIMSLGYFGRSFVIGYVLNTA